MPISTFACLGDKKPVGPSPLLSLRDTRKGMKLTKDFFQDNLAEELNLQRVSALLFLRKGSGVNG